MIIKNIQTINESTIKIIIDDAKNRQEEQYKLYDRYKAGSMGTPIRTRKYEVNGVEQLDKINHKINNDFFGEIVDRKIGFFTGNPIVTTIIKQEYSDSEYKKNIDTLAWFNRYNMMADIDTQTAKMCAICGEAGRLAYINTDGEIEIMVVNPWECIYIGDDSAYPDYTIRHYKENTYNANGTKTEIEHVELYDKYSVKYYYRKDNDADFKTEKEDYIHQFSLVPLIGFVNNDELQGDTEKVLELIDAYDRSLSDINNEIEQFRMAYLKFINCSIKQEDIVAAQRTGAFSLPFEGADVAFITKDWNDAFLQNHLKKLEENIYHFSKTPNIRDINFAGTVTGIAMKFKFGEFEDKCILSELKFKKGLYAQYDIIFEILNAKFSSTIVPEYLEFVFTRNYPQNLLEEAQILQTLRGLVSDKTALSLMSFIDDPDAELKQMEEDNQRSIENSPLSLAYPTKKKEEIPLIKSDSTASPNIQTI